MDTNNKIKKKISRKEINKMSPTQILQVSAKPYRRLVTFIKPYKKRFILSIIFSILFGIFAAVLVFGTKFAISVALPGASGATINIPLAAKPVLDKLNLTEKIEQFNAQSQAPKGSIDAKRPISVVIIVASIIPLLFFMRGILQFLSSYFMTWVGAHVLYDLRSTIFSKLMLQSQEFYNEQKTGNLIQTVFNQTSMAAGAAMTLATDVVKHPISIITYVSVLFYFDWLFAICTLFVFPLCLLPIILLSKNVRKTGLKEQEQAGMLMVAMQETFAGIRVVKAHAREEYESKKFNQASKGMMNFIINWQKAMQLVAPLVETVASIGIAAGLVYCWYFKISAGDFLVWNLCLIAIYPHAKALSRIQLLLEKTLAAATGVFALMDKEPDIQDAQDAKILDNVKGEIKFDDVTFAYKKDIPAVKNISFTFEAGKSYALVGTTGAGKSTLFSLIMRFYDPQTGSISVDGINIKDIAQTSLRDNIGLVNQDVFLFHDSIKNNILYGKLDATDEEVEFSAQQANAEIFIQDEKTGGYDTVIGDSGSKLSGGQKQRITIARAILRNAPILLLDEATSAVDSETELKIKTAIDKLSKGKTTIAIAHRLSTVLNADKLIYLERGEIKETGTHEELLKKCPAYNRLYRLQFSIQEEEQEIGEEKK